MGDFVFNVAKGRVNELHDRVDGNDPANSVLVIVLLKTVESDALMKDRADLAAILGANTEASFTNYARKSLTDANISASAIDNTNDRREADIPDQTWSSAGGASNDTLAKLLVCYDLDSTGGADSAIVPLTAHDFVITTNGGDITAVVAAAGYFRAS